MLLSDSIATKGTLKGSFNDVQVELFESSAIHHDSLFNKLATSLLVGRSAKEMIEAIERSENSFRDQEELFLLSPRPTWLTG